MTTPMPTVTLKNLPTDLHRRLKARARDHRRSLNREIIASLEAAVSVERVDVDALLARARALRRGVRGQLTDAEIERFTAAGRP